MINFLLSCKVESFLLGFAAGVLATGMYVFVVAYRAAWRGLR